MQQFDQSNKQLEQWIRVEHYRLHCAERWADSDYKEAVLAAIHSTIKTLEAACETPVGESLCMVCTSRQAAPVLELPSRLRELPLVARLAA
jgi:uncharacterized protein YecE (DUF72 family)